MRLQIMGLFFRRVMTQNDKTTKQSPLYLIKVILMVIKFIQE